MTLACFAICLGSQFPHHVYGTRHITALSKITASGYLDTAPKSSARVIDHSDVDAAGYSTASLQKPMQRKMYVFMMSLQVMRTLGNETASFEQKQQAVKLAKHLLDMSLEDTNVTVEEHQQAVALANSILGMSLKDKNASEKEHEQALDLANKANGNWVCKLALLLVKILRFKPAATKALEEHAMVLGIVFGNSLRLHAEIDKGLRQVKRDLQSPMTTHLKSLVKSLLDAIANAVVPMKYSSVRRTIPVLSSWITSKFVGGALAQVEQALRKTCT